LISDKRLHKKIYFFASNFSFWWGKKPRHNDNLSRPPFWLCGDICKSISQEADEERQHL